LNARLERLVVLSGYDPPPDWPGLWIRKPIKMDELRWILIQIGKGSP
jgi:hypothetical protein